MVRTKKAGMRMIWPLKSDGETEGADPVDLGLTYFRGILET